MYGKVLSRKPMLFFQCVPPYTLADEASAAQRERLSHIGAELHEGSVYYYWWAFLRWNEAYRACCESGGASPMAPLYADFGDVRDGSFWKWWIGGGRMLFCEPPDDQIIPCLTPADAPNDESRVLLSIPVTGDLERTMAELRKKLRPSFEMERKRRKEAGLSHAGFSRAKYQVVGKAVPEALYAILKVWEAKQADPDASNYEIGVRSGIVGRMADNSQSADLLNVVGATVSRHIRDAKALIANVGEGRFPDKSMPKVGKR